MSELLVSHLSAADPILGVLMRAVGPCLLVPELDCEPFQALAQAIAHQQLHGTAARTILKRFVDSCGRGAFPSAERVLATPEQTLRAAGFSGPKIAALKDLAAKTIAGIVPKRKQLMQLEDADVIERLTQVRGIGRWTVEMLLIFQLGRPDVLPVDDFGVRNGFRLAYGLSRMPDPRALAAYGERWSPYRSTAAWYLWRAVELQRAGGLPAPAERIRLPRVLRRRVARKKTQRSKAGASRHTLRKRPAAGRAKSVPSGLRRRRKAAAPTRQKARRADP